MESVWDLQEVKRMMNRAKYAKNANYVHHMRRMNKMGKVQIEIPDDGWFRGELDFRPQDKQLCVVIPNIGNKFPMICQWRWGNHNHIGMDAFCDISERFYHESMGIIEEEFRPDYLGMGSVDRWKPLGLPKDVEERVLEEIKKWFDEDE